MLGSFATSFSQNRQQKEKYEVDATFRGLELEVSYPIQDYSHTNATTIHHDILSYCCTSQ
jgi:hypothetical protein